MANQAVTLKDPVTGDLLYPATVASQVFNEDGTSFKDTVDSLKTSVSEGKALIAAAVTDKGVETAADATFATMAGNIAGIISGIKYQFTVVDDATNNPINGAVVEIYHNSEYVNTAITDINGIAEIVSVYCSVDYIATYSTLVDVKGTVTATEVGILPVDIRMRKLNDIGLGETISWDNKEWKLCHQDTDNNLVYLFASDVVSKTIFGSNISYAGSTLAQVAKDYESQFSDEALAVMADITVEGVTGKVFVLSRTHFTGGFSWLRSNSNRSASTEYWTSTGKTGLMVYTYKGDGNDNYDAVSRSNGFRPCICIDLKLLNEGVS